MRAKAGSAMDRLRRLLRHPLFEGVVVGAILVSVIELVMERLLPPFGASIATWVGDALVWAFRVEIALRLVASPNPARTARRFLPDIIAVLPLPDALRALRALRVLRLLRAGAIMVRSARWSDAAQATLAQIANIIAVSLVLVVGAAAALPVVEPHAVATYDDALWFSLLSMVAGEPIGATPVTDAGRLVALVVMLGGLTVFGVFVGTVSGGVAASLSSGLGLEGDVLDELREHVVVLGWNRSAPVVLDELLRAHELRGADIVLVTEGPRPEELSVERFDAARLHHLQGDWTQLSVLEQAGIAYAHHALILTDETIARSDQDRDARTVLAALLIERTAGGPDHNTIHTVAEVTTGDVEPLLRHAGVEAIVRGDWYAGVILGSAARNPGIVPVLDEVLSSRLGSSFFTVRLDDAWGGREVRELHRELHEAHQASLVALHMPGGPKVNPSPSLRIDTPAEAVVLAVRVPRSVRPPA